MPLASNQSQSHSRLRVFLCHAAGDKAQVRKLYDRLLSDGIEPWLDERQLLAGQDCEKRLRTFRTVSRRALQNTINHRSAPAPRAGMSL